MINLKFKGLRKQAAVVTTKQGFKGGYKPRNALNGGNGSFVVKEQPAKLYIYLEFPDGHESAYEIISYVRAISGKSRITEKFVSNLEQKILANGGLVKYDEKISRLCLEEFF